MRPESVRRATPVAVGVLVLVLIAVGWALVRAVDPPGSDVGGTPGSGGGSTGEDPTAGEPEPLRLLGWPGATTAASGLTDPRVTLAPGTELPTGPGTGVVHRLDPADGEAAAGLSGSAMLATDDPAAGWLARGGPSVVYPLVSAKTAFEALTAERLPAVSCPDVGGAAAAASADDPTEPNVCAAPVTVVGARLGLSVQISDDGPLLVPSWLFDTGGGLFDVTGGAAPLVVVAVEPRLIEAADDAPGSVGAGEPAGGSAGAGEQPGGGSGTAAESSRITSVTRAADDRSVEVTFWGGVPECYSYQVRAEQAEQTVTLTVVEKLSTENTVCIEIAVEITKTVRLDAPLGLRRVTDAVNGETLLGPVR